LAIILGTILGYQNTAYGDPYTVDSDQPVIAIIIDDLGIQRDLGQRALTISDNLTYAILPHSPYGTRMANQAYKLGKEVMLHLPMEALDHRRIDRGALTNAQDRKQFLQTLRDDLRRIPHVRGVNNHMGSQLTQQKQQMTWLMEELAQYNNLYFIDSRTTARSVGYQSALEQGLPTLKRNVFLDNNTDIAAINRQFKKLLNLARRYGSAVAIGHPYPETLTYLENMLPALPLLGVRLLPASQLIEHKTLIAKQRPITSPLQTAELLDIIETEQTSLDSPKLVP